MNLVVGNEYVKIFLNVISYICACFLWRNNYGDEIFFASPHVFYHLIIYLSFDVKLILRWFSCTNWLNSLQEEVDSKLSPVEKDKPSITDTADDPSVEQKGLLEESQGNNNKAHVCLASRRVRHKCRNNYHQFMVFILWDLLIRIDLWQNFGHLLICIDFWQNFGHLFI